MNSFEELNAKINRLKRDGGVGWSEPGMVLTWDGDTSGAIDTGEFIMVKIHDKNVDLTKVVSLSIRSAVNPEEGEKVLGPEMFGFIEGEGGVSGVFISSENVNNATLGVVSIPAGVEGFDEGVYIQTNVPLVYISQITFAETIHPISDKYLPEGFGGGGPVVVDLNNYMLGENTLLATIFYAFTMGGGVSTPGNALDEAFWQDVANKRPVVFLLDLSAVGMSEKIYISNVNRVFKEDGVAMVDFSCVVKYTDGKFYQMLVGMIRGSESREPTIAMKRTLVDR